MNEFENRIVSEVKQIAEKYEFRDMEPVKFSRKEIASSIEHTNLKPTATGEDIKRLCEEAMEYEFRSVCINPSHISLAKEFLEGSDVKIVTVIGFPLGATTTASKVFETENAIKLGADEIDMVINQGRLKSGNYETVLFDISKVVKCAGIKPVKVIFETCNLTKDEIIAACLICREAGCEYVKTSTGFSTRGATVEDVDLMKYCVGESLKVKAAGGVRDYEMACVMKSHGANLLGTSSGIAILNSEKSDEGY